MTKKRIRNINEILIVNPISQMYVGDEYVLWAIGLQDESENTFRWDMRGDNNSVSITSSNNSIISCQFGVLFANSVGTATITVKYIGQNISKQIEVNVVERPNINSDSLKILNVDLNTYNLNNTGTSDTGTANTQGIINIFKYASENNYDKIIFPTGTYNIQGDVGTISYPSNMIVDWNNSIIQLEFRKNKNISEWHGIRAGNEYAYKMFNIENVENLSVLNGKFYAENYISDKKYHIEHEQTLELTGSKNVNIVNCEFSYAPGFNVGLGYKLYTRIPFKLNNAEIGGYTDAGENNDNISTRFRCKDYIDISSLHNYNTNTFGVGCMQGYGGYAYVVGRIYNIYFFDDNKQFISKLNNCLQFEYYEFPSTAKYCKIEFYQNFLPASGDPDFGGIVHIFAVSKLQNIIFKNCKFQETMSTGISPQGGNNVILDGCEFINCGYYDPASHIDWEDGGQHIHGHIVKNCKFICNNGQVKQVISVKSRNIAMFDNEFQDTTLDFRTDSENYRIFKNNWTKNKSGCTKISLSAKTDAVVAYNSYIKGITFNIGTTYGDNTIWNFSNVEI